MTAGRREYFGKENFANFTRKPLKQCKTRSSAVRDPQNLDPAAWRCVKQRQHLPFQGLHPSRVGRQWFSGGQQVGETAAGADHGCWPGRPQWLLLRRLRVGDTLRAFARSLAAARPCCLCSEAEPIRRQEHTDQPFTAQWPTSLAGSALTVRSLRDS